MFVLMSTKDLKLNKRNEEKCKNFESAFFYLLYHQENETAGYLAALSHFVNKLYSLYNSDSRALWDECWKLSMKKNLCIIYKCRCFDFSILYFSCSKKNQPYFVSLLEKNDAM